MQRVAVYSGATLRRHLDPERPVFTMRDETAYALDESGAIVRLNKDRRSHKERKRAKREAREQRASQ